MMSWSEPTANHPYPNDSSVSLDIYGQNPHSRIRRFIVVKQGTGYSICLPVNTYGGQGTLKYGLNVQDHALIYTGATPPPLLLGEEELEKEPLRIIPTDSSYELDVASRVNFGKVYTVEHNLKVKDVGLISEQSLPKLLYHYNKLHIAG